MQLNFMYGKFVFEFCLLSPHILGCLFRFFRLNITLQDYSWDYPYLDFRIWKNSIFRTKEKVLN